MSCVLSPEEAVAKSQLLHRLRAKDMKRANDASVLTKALDRQTRGREQKAEKDQRVEKAIKAQHQLEKKFKGVAVSYGKFALLETSEDEAHDAPETENQENDRDKTYRVPVIVTKTKKETKQVKNSVSKKKDQKKGWMTGLIYFAIGASLGLGALVARPSLGF
jgi:hypothetical protein